MKKCRECGTIIYDSHKYREIKKTLINLDKRYENVVDDLCQHCLCKEQTKYIRSKILERAIQRYKK